MSEGQAPITGLSLMVTLNVQLLAGAHPLVAVQVTVVVPTLNVEPEEGEHTTVAAGSPVAVGSVQVAIPSSHCTISEGHALIAGGMQPVVTWMTLELSEVLSPPVARTR